jgi:hypothetical protein
MSKFKVGDQVIGQNFTFSVWRNGLYGEVVEIGPLDSIRIDNGKDSIADYAVRWAGGDITSCAAGKIRKRRPPESYKGQYDTNSRTFRDVMNNPGRKIEAPDMVEVYREIQQRIKS